MRIVVDFSDYKPWSGAVNTYERIEREGKLDELEGVLDGVFEDATCSDTELNDLLWFESDTVFHWLGMKTDDDVAEDEARKQEIKDKLQQLSTATNENICELVQELGDLVEIDGCHYCPFCDADDCDTADIADYQEELEVFKETILDEMELMFDE